MSTLSHNGPEFIPPTLERSAAPYAYVKSADLLIVAAVFLGFLDESIRKAFTATPVHITVVKDLFAAWAAVAIAGRMRLPRRPVGLLLLWAGYNTMSVLIASAKYGAGLQFIAAGIRTYSLGVVYFVCGYYACYAKHLHRRLARVIAGCVATAVIVGLLQEHVRTYLPSFLTTRVFIEKHALASGAFVESVFNSAATFSSVLIVTFSVILGAALTKERVRKAVPLALIALLYAIFITRVRVMGVLAAGVFALQAAFVFFVYGSSKIFVNRMTTYAIVGAFAVALTYVLGIHDPQSLVSSDLSADTKFYERAFTWEEIQRRVEFAFDTRNFADEKFLFGYGSGTGTMVKVFLPPRILDSLPKAVDAGARVLFFEGGMLGSIVFLLTYGWLHARLVLRSIETRRAEFLGPMSAVLVMFVYFYLKNHAALANGFMHGEWMAILGWAYGIDGALPAKK